MRGRHSGFSLVELLVVLVITGVLATLIGALITGPIQSYVDQSRRAELVDLAESGLQRMARDLRRALPNSVRINGSTLELLNVKDAARYRAGTATGVGGGGHAVRLQFNKQDTEFNLQGPRQPYIAATDRLVIYHLGDGQPGGSAYQGDAVITPAGMRISVSADPNLDDEYHVTLDTPGHQFAFESPSQRIYVVDGPIAYHCDNGAGTLRRETGYTFQPAIPADPSAGALVTSGLTKCVFSYDAGTATRNAVVTLEVAVTRGGETVNLTRQVQVVNAP